MSERNVPVSRMAMLARDPDVVWLSSQQGWFMPVTTQEEIDAWGDDAARVD